MKFFKQKNKQKRNYKSVDNIALQKNNYYRSQVKTNTRTKNNLTEKENNSTKRKLTVSSLINILLVIGAFLLAIFATTMNTSPIVEVSGDENISYDIREYERVSGDILSSSLFNRSKILFQQEDFETKLRDYFPEISTVTANVPLGGRSLAVFVSLSKPFAQVYNGENSGIINSEGVLIKTDVSEDNDLLKVRFAQPQENFELRSRVLTRSEVGLLNSLDKEMESLVFKDGKTAEIKEVLFNVAEGQFEASVNDMPFIIKLSSFNDGDVQVGGAKATLKQLDDENSLPTRYIDIRVPGRAFVI